jgi:hypothetical protein
MGVESSQTRLRESSDCVEPDRRRPTVLSIHVQNATESVISTSSRYARAMPVAGAGHRGSQDRALSPEIPEFVRCASVKPAKAACPHIRHRRVSIPRTAHRFIMPFHGHHCPGMQQALCHGKAPDRWEAAIAATVLTLPAVSLILAALNATPYPRQAKGES